MLGGRDTKGTESKRRSPLASAVNVLGHGIGVSGAFFTTPYAHELISEPLRTFTTVKYGAPLAGFVDFCAFGLMAIMFWALGRGLVATAFTELALRRARRI